MKSDSRLVYTAMTPTVRDAYTGYISRVGTEARLGYTFPGHLSRRAVIYVSDKLHGNIGDYGPENLDTWFTYDPEMGAVAVQGTAEHTTCKVVEALEPFSYTPYDMFHGIRVSQSDKPEYTSKIVVYYLKDADYDAAIAAVAQVIFGEGTPFSTQWHELDHMTEAETELRQAFNALDY